MISRATVLVSLGLPTVSLICPANVEHNRLVRHTRGQYILLRAGLTARNTDALRGDRRQTKPCGDTETEFNSLKIQHDPVAQLDRASAF